jgi:hypothetical protein
MPERSSHRRAGFREAFADHFDREGQAQSSVKFLNNLLLPAGVVHFNPVPVWVAEIDLLDPIRPESNGARCALKVFVGDARLCQPGHEILQRRDAKTGVISFRLIRPAGCSFDDMQLFALTDREPGMFAIAKRLWQGIKAQHITVKGAAFFEVNYINSDMIKNRLL